MADADVKLLFGAQEGSLGKITSDIQGMLKRIDKDAFKIDIKADLSQAEAAVKNFGNRIKELLPNASIQISVGAAGNASADVINNIRQAGNAVVDLNGALEQVKSNATIGILGERMREVAVDAGKMASTTISVINDIGKKVQEVEQDIAVALQLQGVDTQTANKLAESFVSLSGDLKKAKVEVVDFGGKGADAVKVVINAVNDAGDAITKTITSIKDAETGEWTTKLTDNSVIDIAKRQKDAFDEAKKSVKLYYDLLAKVSNTNGGVVERDGKWTDTTSGKWPELTNAINEASAARDRWVSGENARNMSEQQHAEIIQLNTDLERKHALAIEERTNKERAAAESKAKSAQEFEKDINLLNSANLTYQRGTEAIQRWAGAQNSSNTSSREVYSSLVSCNDALKKAIDNYDGSEKATKNLRNAQNSLQSAIKTTDETLKKNGESASLLKTKLTDAAKAITGMMSVTRIIMAVYRELKKMVQAAIEVDTAMNQMQIVTRETDATMSQFGQTAANIAKEIGASMTDFISSATTFARLGYDLDESSILSKYTTMLQNVGNINATDAQNAMTAIIKAFDMDVNDIESVMDKLVTVGNNFPISVSQIAEGMNNASSSLAAAGNTFEQSVALLTAANTTVQNASKAATGIRTISARLRNTTAELDELGETITQAKYDEMIKQLADLDIAIKKENGEYRSTYEVLSDIAAKWSTMSDDVKAALTTALAGTRMQDIFNSIINQFQEAQGAMDAMTDSAGALTKAYETRMNSVEAHTQRFKTAFSELSMDVFDTEVIKEFIDALTGALELLDKISKVGNKFGGIKTLAKFISPFFQMFDNGISLLQKLNNLIDSNFFDKIGNIFDNRFISFIKEALGFLSGGPTLPNILNAVLGFFDDNNESLDDSTDKTEKYNNALEKTTENERKSIDVANKRLEIAKEILSLKYGDGNFDKGMITDMVNMLSHISTSNTSDLSIAKKLLTYGEYDSWEQLSSAIETYKTSIDGVADATRDGLDNLWISDSFSDAREEIEKFAKAESGITADNVIELCSKYEGLAEILNTDGMSAQFLANVLQQKVTTGNGFELITGAALELNKALQGAAGGFDEVIAAKARYDAAVGGGEKDDNFKSMADAWTKLDEEFANGNLNSNQFWASAEYLFGADKLEEWGWEDGIDKIHDALVGTKLVFEDAESSGEGLLDKMEEIAKEGQILGKDGSVIAEITDDSWSIDNKSIDEFAEKMGMSKEAVLACIQALDKLGVVHFYDSDEVMEVLKKYQLAADGLDGAAVNAELFVSQLETLGYSKSTIHSIMKDLEETEGVSFISTTQSVENLTNSLVNLGIASSQNGQITIDITNLADLLSKMNFTKEEAAAIVEKLGEVDNVTFKNAEGETLKVEDAMNELEKHDFAEVKDGMEGVEDGAKDATDAVKDTCTYMETLETRVNRLNGKVITITVNVKKNDPNGILDQTYSDTSRTTKKSGDQDRLASGTKNARGGEALTGEEGEELVLHKNSAYLAGTNGPEFVNLDKGDTVYTAEETAAILRRRHSLRGTIPAYASGKPGRKTYDSIKSDSSGSKSEAAKAYTAATSSSSSSSSSSVSETESEFERLYKYHKHLIAMDAEETADFLEWLNDAYQEAYRNNEIELDDFYKYQEEVYDGMKDLFKDHMNDIEHEIDMRSAFEGEDKTILSLYKGLIADVEKEIADARKRGLSDNDEYIQDLQKSWASYVESVKDLQEDIKSNTEDAVDDLINIRIDMLKQEIKEEKDAIKTKLDMLKDFYDKQKDMLQDEYDEDKYLEEQREKRKKIADIQQQISQLQYDDSAWAQKRRIELAQELTDAQKELDDFEKEHALKTAQDQLDKLYEIQEKELNAQEDLLEEQEDNAKGLRDKAIEDIKNGNEELFKEMVDWNNQYGDGIEDTIKTAWENAYKALLAYKELYDEMYHGINLANATNYVPPAESWDTSSVSGKQAVPTAQTSESSEEKSGSGKAPLDEATKRKVAAAIWAGTYGWGSNPERRERLEEIFGSGNGIQDLVSRGVGADDDPPDASYTYLNMRKKILGYGYGTGKATAGWHKLDEFGTETIFESKDGTRYKMFSGGEKVLNATASNFLYEFANNGMSVLEKAMKSIIEGSIKEMTGGGVYTEVNMGDIIVQGNADKATVSEIRRAQRDMLDTMLREMNKLSK